MRCCFLNTGLLQFGIKKIVVPAIANKIANNSTAKSKIDLIDDKIARIDKLSNLQKQDMSDNPTEPSSTHISTSNSHDNDVATSCIACARSHIATVSSSLKESLRFSREHGILHPEVQTRLATAEEEITALERYDWSPERIEHTPQTDKQIVLHFLPIVRNLRQEISTIQSHEDLEKCASKAGTLLTDYRTQVLHSRLNQN